MEQTLAILYGKEGVNLKELIESILSKAGFEIKTKSFLTQEDLDESGIEKFEGEESNVESVGDEEEEHLVLVLERLDSVSVWKELVGKANSLNHNCLANLYPNLQVYASPSISAAKMSIEILFPNLNNQTIQRVQQQRLSTPSQSEEDLTIKRNCIYESPSSPIVTPTTPLTISTNVAPFALSNLSHPSPPRSKNLSKSMERALALHDYEDDRKVDLVDQESVVDYQSEEEEEEEAEILSASLSDAGSKTSNSPIRISPPTSPTSKSFTSLPMTHSNSNTSTSSASSSIGTPSFRDDSLPSSKGNPHPRLTKTAKLRLGMPIESPRVRRPSTSLSNISLDFKSPRVIAPVKSLEAPTIVPRSTKSSALRTGNDTTPANSNSSLTPSKPREIASGTSDRSSNAIFDNVPGFKRRESITVASTAKPKIEVRMTKGSSMRNGLPVELASNGLTRRAEKGEDLLSKKGKGEKQVSTFGREDGNRMGPPPTNNKRKTNTGRASVGGQNDSINSNRMNILEDPKQVDTPRPNSRIIRRQSSAVLVKMNKTAMLRSQTPVEPMPKNRRNSSAPMNYEGVPGHSGRETISVASSKPPIIQPRTNRSTMLRMGGGASENTNTTTSSFTSSTNRPRSSSETTTTRSQSRLSISTSTSTIPKVPKLPSIVPRMNRTEQLRIEKKEREELEKLKLANRKVRKPGEMLLKVEKSKPLALGDLNGRDSPRRSNFVE